MGDDNKLNELIDLIRELVDIEITVEELNSISNSGLRFKIFDIIGQIKKLNEKID